MSKLTLDVLEKALRAIDQKNGELSTKSLNHLPEFYLPVKLSDQLHKIGYGFELEKRVQEVTQTLGIDHADLLKVSSQLSLKMGVIEEKTIKRITNGRIDLAVLTGTNRSLKHLIEFKIGSKMAQLEQDMLRLMCFALASKKKSVQRSFLVFVSGLSEANIDSKLDTLCNSFGVDISYKYFTSKLQCTRESSVNRDIRVWIVEIKNKI